MTTVDIINAPGIPSTVVTITPPAMSMGQFIARAESYGNALWEAQNVGRQVAAKSNPGDEERRVHGRKTAHVWCETCTEETAKGWQPIGTLKDIGDSECMGNCDCYFEYRDIAGKKYVSPWGKHTPKVSTRPKIAKSEQPAPEPISKPASEVPGLHPAHEVPPEPHIEPKPEQKPIKIPAHKPPHETVYIDEQEIPADYIKFF